MERASQATASALVMKYQVRYVSSASALSSGIKCGASLLKLACRYIFSFFFFFFRFTRCFILSALCWPAAYRWLNIKIIIYEWINDHFLANWARINYICIFIRSRLLMLFIRCFATYFLQNFFFFFFFFFLIFLIFFEIVYAFRFQSTNLAGSVKLFKTSQQYLATTISALLSLSKTIFSLIFSQNNCFSSC